MIQNGEISFGHAKVLLGLPTPQAMVNLAERIRRASLSVRQTEEIVVRSMNPQAKVEKVREVDPNVREAEKELERALGVRVKIADRRGRGKILLEYTSLEDFDRVLAALTGK